jgi:hypothetical protein
LGDILQLLFTDILGRQLKLTPDLPLRILGDANATGFRNSFQSCCNVHPITEDVATVEHDIPDVDPNAELDPFLLRDIGVALGHAALDIDSTAYGIHNAGEHRQQPISGVLDDPPTVLSDLGIDEGTQVILKLGVRSLLIQAGPARSLALRWRPRSPGGPGS